MSGRFPVGGQGEGASLAAERGPPQPQTHKRVMDFGSRWSFSKSDEIFGLASSLTRPRPDLTTWGRAHFLPACLTPLPARLLFRRPHRGSDRMSHLPFPTGATGSRDPGHRVACTGPPIVTGRAGGPLRPVRRPGPDRRADRGPRKAEPGLRGAMGLAARPGMSLAPGPGLKVLPEVAQCDPAGPGLCAIPAAAAAVAIFRPRSATPARRTSGL